MVNLTFMVNGTYCARLIRPLTPAAPARTDQQEKAQAIHRRRRGLAAKECIELSISFNWRYVFWFVCSVPFGSTQTHTYTPIQYNDSNDPFSNSIVYCHTQENDTDSSWQAPGVVWVRRWRKRRKAGWSRMRSKYCSVG